MCACFCIQQNKEWERERESSMLIFIVYHPPELMSKWWRMSQITDKLSCIMKLAPSKLWSPSLHYRWHLPKSSKSIKKKKNTLKIFVCIFLNTDVSCVHPGRSVAEWICDASQMKSKWQAEKNHPSFKYSLPNMIYNASDGNGYMVHPAQGIVSSVGTNLQSMTEHS